jgi:hypothetical protein
LALPNCIAKQTTCMMDYNDKLREIGIMPDPSSSSRDASKEAVFNIAPSSQNAAVLPTPDFGLENIRAQKELLLPKHSNTRLQSQERCSLLSESSGASSSSFVFSTEDEETRQKRKQARRSEKERAKRRRARHRQEKQRREQMECPSFDPNFVLELTDKDSHEMRKFMLLDAHKLDRIQCSVTITHTLGHFWT